MVSLPNISIKGPKDRARCLQNRQTPVHIVYEKLKSFSVRHCDQYNSVWVKKLTRPGSGTFLSWSESLARCLPSVWMNSARPSLGKQWTGGQSSELARGLASSALREVIVTWKLPKASATPKAESKICFHFR